MVPSAALTLRQSQLNCSCSLFDLGHSTQSVRHPRPALTLHLGMPCQAQHSKGVFSSATHTKHSCTQLKPSAFLTFSAGPFSLALSLALFPSSPSWTKSSSKFISSSSTRCSTWMLAAMLARALMTAKEQCLGRENSYEQAIPQVLYCQCFLHNTDSNSCNKATDIFHFHPGFFSCCFYEQHITLLTIEIQLVFKWKTTFKLWLWRMFHLWCWHGHKESTLSTFL